MLSRLTTISWLNLMMMKLIEKIMQVFLSILSLSPLNFYSETLTFGTHPSLILLSMRKLFITYRLQAHLLRKTALRKLFFAEISILILTLRQSEHLHHKILKEKLDTRNLGKSTTRSKILLSNLPPHTPTTTRSKRIYR